MERAFSSRLEPVQAVCDALRLLARLAATSAEAGVNVSLGGSESTAEESTAAVEHVEQVTGEHYGRLFQVFTDHSYWREPVELLRQRLTRNSIDLNDLDKKSVLDAGCGGGRYSVAWRLLGAGRVMGIDISETGVADAEQRVKAGSVSAVSFQRGDVLNLPVDNDSYDIVFSNGVLHHTVDWQKGVAELVRVLRPGGLGWLYLIEKPGGLFWDVIEILRVAMRGVPRAHARATLRLLGVPANRIFYMLDHVMVPINVRLTPAEIESQLRSSSASNIRRMTRGADFDRVEAIYRGDSFADVKYGVGENRYVFSK
jgi:ubiquinone/menaquinone biosynthesis C-methylase UbiE